MLKIFAPAKINLALDILKKTPSGYHEIQTVFHEMPALSDELEFYAAQNNDKVSTLQANKNAYTAQLPSQKENLAYKALKLVKTTFKIPKLVKIIIRKRIPIASGLGGASSNAAATLKGLNQLWNLNLSTRALLGLAAQLGADVPFFIRGGTALGTHFGEKITRLPEIKCVKFEIIPASQAKKSSISKTERMYKSLDLSKCGKNTDKTQLLIKGIKAQNPKLIIENLHNDFETLISEDLEKALKKGLRLSGSGPTIFSAFSAL
jgi:4-diphosphocytidyl-2-C-methyl-D-erythritol kinase